MSAGSTNSTTVHYTPHSSIPGAQGGAALSIDGNGGSLTGGVEFYFGAIVRIRNVTLSSPARTCLVATQNAYVQINDLVTFGDCSGPQIAISSSWHSRTVREFHDFRKRPQFCSKFWRVAARGRRHNYGVERRHLRKWCRLCVLSGRHKPAGRQMVARRPHRNSQEIRRGSQPRVDRRGQYSRDRGRHNRDRRPSVLTQRATIRLII